MNHPTMVMITDDGLGNEATFVYYGIHQYREARRQLKIMQRLAFECGVHCDSTITVWDAKQHKMKAFK